MIVAFTDKDISKMGASTLAKIIVSFMFGLAFGIFAVVCETLVGIFI